MKLIHSLHKENLFFKTQGNFWGGQAPPGPPLDPPLDIGRTNFWPLEHDDMVRKMTLKLTITLELCVCCKELELIYYLFGLDCDIEERCLPVLSETIKNCTP